jgi:hypothetical protein
MDQRRQRADHAGARRGARGLAWRGGLLGLALLGALLGAAPAAAVEVAFPLAVDYDVLRVALRRHLREHGGTLELWRTPDGCGTLTLRDPVVGPAEGRLRIAGPAAARAGVPFFGWCLASVSWSGHAEVLTRPELGRDWQLHLRDLDIQLLDRDRRRTSVATRLFEVVRDWAAAELATFSFDLGPPVEDVKALVRTFGGETGPIADALRTLRPVALAVEPEALRLRVAFDLPPIAPTPPAPERALTPAELRRWEAMLERWDAFLAFVVKDLGAGTADPELRTELLDLLLTARREVVGVLARGPEPGVDPVRPLFLGLWERLRAIIRRAVVAGADEHRALRYVVFLAAGEALAAINAAAPAAGLDFSGDGLRRLARTVAPAHPGDPLEFSDAPDARLQEIFRFRDPDAPPRRPRRHLPGGPGSWLGPRTAHAQGADEWRAVGDRLDRWVPDDAELAVYRDTVARLLTLAAERSYDPEALPERFDALFTSLVWAVAWQESCWRQFVRTRAGIVPIQSSTGDVGIMQINVRVWRGFFNPVKLRWNAAYNAGAGAEILWQLLLRYGTREARERLDNAARATYSAYHGGPQRYRRYRSADVAPHLQAVDRAFWEKYQLVRAGRADDRVLCLPPRAGRS